MSEKRMGTQLPSHRIKKEVALCAELVLLGRKVFRGGNNSYLGVDNYFVIASLGLG